ncbi:MAG: bifunctional oligoribonuclease/PAP phosphatase NrnA [Deltaproteobacteria bacterium]|nr:bifunctional oligoribonuclease/PAP phosphatase NrnA [Deltaproteobacteria bacterium]
MEASVVNVPAAEERAPGTLARCVSALERGERFLITMHEFPDGDALGSALALCLALKERGKSVTVYSPQGAPQNLRFLPGAADIVRSLSRDARFDVCLACDAGDDARLGPDLPERERRGETLNLDHHPRSKAFGDVNLVDSTAASVGVLVWRLLKALDQPISRDIAACLWVSIASDTGNFRHSNTNAECMRIAWELVERGVRPGEISSRMYESQPLARVRLLAEVLKTLVVSKDGRVAWVVASREVFEAAGTVEETADGFISYPRSIEGVEVALLLREEGPQRQRVSFRSRGKVDVGAIATRFGGGGHHNASGCSVPGTLEEVRALVLREVQRGMERARIF